LYQLFMTIKCQVSRKLDVRMVIPAARRIGRTYMCGHPKSLGVRRTWSRLRRNASARGLVLRRDAVRFDGLESLGDPFATRLIDLQLGALFDAGSAGYTPPPSGPASGHAARPRGRDALGQHERGPAVGRCLTCVPPDSLRPVRRSPADGWAARWQADPQDARNRYVPRCTSTKTGRATSNLDGGAAIAIFLEHRRPCCGRWVAARCPGRELPGAFRGVVQCHPAARVS